MKTRVLISSLLAAVIFAASPLVHAATTSQAKATDTTPKCQTAFHPGEQVERTPMCRYLEKCCMGNTSKSKKCCEGAVKKCGGKEPS